MSERLTIHYYCVRRSSAGCGNGISKVNKLDFDVGEFCSRFLLSLRCGDIFRDDLNRNAKTGFVNATLLELLCIPYIDGAGFDAARFSYLSIQMKQVNH
jgi:hypothetical protein